MFLVAATLIAVLPMAPPAPQPAAPPAHVVVLTVPGQPIPDGFLDALRIQLIGAGTATIGGDVTGATTAAKLESAAPVLDSPGAMAVWVEAGDEPGYLLYIASRRRGRAVVDVFHIAAPGGPEAVRALALKVREVVDLAALPVREENHPPPPPPPPPPVAAEPWRSEVVVGAGSRAIEGGLGQQLGINAEGGIALSRERLRGELVASAWWASALQEENASGSVRVRELGLTAQLRTIYSVARGFGAGGGFAFAMRRVVADGRTPADSTGSDVVWIPTLGVDLEARQRLFGPLEVRAWAGFELAVLRQRFLVNQLQIIDLGRMRAEVGVALVGHLR